MESLTRRACISAGICSLTSVASGAGLFGRKKQTSPSRVAGKRRLPMATIFKGEDKFRKIVKKAKLGNWGTLPIGQRIIRIAKELEGVPYQNWTLEIDDRIESPSINMIGLDCWTFFETCLGTARMLGYNKSNFQPADLLREVEFTRYRGGRCNGGYLERIHYLAEWFYENDARGTCDYVTRDFGNAQRISGRKISEMTTLWKSYRYLRNTPSLLSGMKSQENYVQQMPVYYIPKSRVASIESKIHSGDVIGIVTKYNGGFCSHVGLANRTSDGVTRFMHASRDFRKVVVDSSISGYLGRYSKHAGIIVGRPLEVSKTVTKESQYKINLKKLIG